MNLKLPLVFLPLIWAGPGMAQALPLQAAPPLTQKAGPFKSGGHVQGIAVDLKGGYIYYSFTNLLAKYDFSGKLVGTLSGWSGHLGDLDFNPSDGKVYGSLEYGKYGAFYIAVIDGDQIDRAGMTSTDTAILRTVYLPEVGYDYAATAPAHRYGCSGIDGVAFGPAFGRADGRRYLTVAYGIYGDAKRTDNDHQVLLQYDIGDWDRYAEAISEANPHHHGPLAARGKYFVRTGNTRYGVQNLAYDETLGRWFMGVYKGSKPTFPNYGLYAVEARSQPKRGELVGVPAPAGNGWEQGLILPLSKDGLMHRPSRVRGWNVKADVGIQPLGNGHYYLATNVANGDGQSADIRLVRWTGRSQEPFEAEAAGRATVHP